MTMSTRDVTSRTQVAAARAALAAVVLDLTGVFVNGGRFIELGASATSIRDAYVALGVRPAVHALIITIVMALLIWFAAALRGVLASSEPEGSPWPAVFFGSVLVIVGVEFVRALVLATVGLASDQLSADVVAVLHLLSELAGPITAVPVATSLVAVWRAARGGRLPAWIARAAPAVAAVWLLSAVRLVTTDETVWRLSIPAFVAYGAFVIALATSMMRGHLRAPGARIR